MALCCLMITCLALKARVKMRAELIVGSELEIGHFCYMSLIIKAIYLSHIGK